MLRNLEYVACYYITGSYKTDDYGYCMKTKHFRDLAYAVSFLPYYWRAMQVQYWHLQFISSVNCSIPTKWNQLYFNRLTSKKFISLTVQCARRWFDEGQTSHLINLGKYVSAMLAAGAKVAYEKEPRVGWLCLVVVMSSGATLYQLYWDFVKDWGLLQMNSKNPWLRNELMLRRKIIYYFSMVYTVALFSLFKLGKFSQESVGHWHTIVTYNSITLAPTKVILIGQTTRLFEMVKDKTSQGGQLTIFFT